MKKLFIHRYLSLIVILITLMLTVGYSAFSVKMDINDTSLEVRVKQDIRVTGVTVSDRSNAGISNYEDYNKNSISTGISLPNENSTITYNVEITNIGSGAMGINSIDGLPSNLEYQVSDYEMQKPLCDVNNKCTLGMVKNIKLTIKYKNNSFDSANVNYNLNVNFNFERLHTITYEDSSGNVYHDYVTDNARFILNYDELGLVPPTEFKVTMGGVVIDDYVSMGPILIIMSVTGDVVIEGVFPDYLMSVAKVNSADVAVLGNNNLKHFQIESIVFSNTKEVPSSAIGSWDVSEAKDNSIIAYYLDSNSNGLYEMVIGQDGGVKANPDSSNLFSYFTNVTSISFDNFITEEVTNMSFLFSNCNNLVDLNLNNINTSNATNLENMFYNCTNLISIDLSCLITGKVTNMSSLFSGCKNLDDFDVSALNTSNVTSMADMFRNCESIKSLDLTSWNINNLVSMDYMFQSCYNLERVNLSGLNASNVLQFDCLFLYCVNLTEIDFTNFKTNKVTSMRAMFRQCEKLTTLDLSSFDTRNVTRMNEMFMYCYNLVSLDLRMFDTINVTNFASMFSECRKITELNISNFNTRKAKDMSSMFSRMDSVKYIYIDGVDFMPPGDTNFSGMFPTTNGNLQQVRVYNISYLEPYFAGSYAEEMRNVPWEVAH